MAKDIGKRDGFQSIEQEVLLTILRTADSLTRIAAATLRPAGLSPTQYNVLRILRGAGPKGLACQEIGSRMITRDPDLTRLFDRLEKRGFILRQRETADRRIVRTSITEGGLLVLASLDQPIEQLHCDLLGHLGPERLSQLLALLQEARAKIDQ
ncbi:MAG: MarR family transcriptional regulator [Planctomycetota bacterium]|nr:MarR family transcriptional regulator [Planctomycetota bacterium]